MWRHAVIRAVERVPVLRDRVLASREYRSDVESDVNGWRSPDAVERQHQMWSRVLRRAASGDVRQDLRALESALHLPQVPVNPLIAEVGCGSGYMSGFILSARPDATYVGIDASPEMVARARRCYPARAFLEGSATSLPLADQSIDVVIDGAALIHIGDASAALSQYRRVARHAVVLHSVTCATDCDGVLMFQKRAYGEKVVEYAYGRSYLEETAERAGLVLTQVFEGLEYDLNRDLGHRSVSETWVLEPVR